MSSPCHFINNWLKNPIKDIENEELSTFAEDIYPGMKVGAPKGGYQLSVFCHRAIPGQYRGLQHGCHVLDTVDFRHLLLLYSHR